MTTPYYEDDAVTLWHGDCRELTAWLAADVLVTDPPYGRRWRQGRLANLNRRTQQENHHDGIAGDMTAGARDEALSLWGDRPAIVFGDLMLPPPHGTRQVLVYRKPPDAGVRGATAGRRRDLEGIYIVGPWPSGLGGCSSLVTTGASIQGSQHGVPARSGHPHAKPIDVMCDLITACAWVAPPAHSRAPSLIADPFAGSGATLVAAKLLGRRAVGVEIDESYCEVAAKRLAQDTLFGGVA